MSQYLTPGWFFSASEKAFAFLHTAYGFRVDSCTYKDQGFYEVFKNGLVGIQICFGWDMHLSVDIYKLIDGKLPHTEVEIQPHLLREYQRITVYWIAKHREAVPNGYTDVMKPNHESIEHGLQVQAAMLADVGADYLRGRFESYADLYVDETKREKE